MSNYLTKVSIHIDTQDGVDGNSTAQFILYYNQQANVIAQLSKSALANDSHYDFDLNLVNNTFDIGLINQTTFYLQIDANGHDSFNGNLSVKFEFTDNSTNPPDITTKDFGYGAFNIGTYHQSNTTRKSVSGL